MSQPSKPSSSFTDPTASPSLQDEIRDAYNKLNQYTQLTPTSQPVGTFNRLPVTGTVPSVARAMSDIQDKLALLASAKLNGTSVKSVQFNYPVLTGASRGVTNALNDLYNRLAVAMKQA